MDRERIEASKVRNESRSLIREDPLGRSALPVLELRCFSPLFTHRVHGPEQRYGAIHEDLESPQRQRDGALSRSIGHGGRGAERKRTRIHAELFIQMLLQNARIKSQASVRLSRKPIRVIMSGDQHARWPGDPLEIVRLTRMAPQTSYRT